MKQTAVEWLVEQYAMRYSLQISETMESEIQQAKAMEKEQIMDAFKNGDSNGTFETINAEQYYNENFKSE